MKLLKGEGQDFRAVLILNTLILTTLRDMWL